MKWILLIATSTFISGCAHSPLQNLHARAPNGQSVSATNLYIYDSDIFNPNTTLQPFLDTEAIFSVDQISGDLVHLQHEGGRCEFDRSIDSRSWPLECQFALQIYYASSKAIRFLLDSGAQIETPVNVTTQQEGAKCFASAGGR